jgi:hypothetical protein
VNHCDQKKKTKHQPTTSQIIKTSPCGGVDSVLIGSHLSVDTLSSTLILMKLKLFNQFWIEDIFVEKKSNNYYPLWIRIYTYSFFKRPNQFFENN